MKSQPIKLGNKNATGYEIPIGPVNLVFAVTDVGLAGCGAIDVAALEKFNYPAARIKAVGKPGIVTLDDLLAGEVKEANAGAQKRGVTVGMSGRDALERL